MKKYYYEKYIKINWPEYSESKMQKLHTWAYGVYCIGS